MKPTTQTLLIIASILCIASPTFAAGKKKEAKPVVADTEAVNAIKPFDKDGNFEISLEELTAVQAAFKANPTGNLKQFDKGGDSVLDETVDRAAMNIKLGEAKMAANADNGKAKKKKKKNK